MILTATEGRGIGITDVLSKLANEPIGLLFAVLTQLGDVWFLLFLGGILCIAAQLSSTAIDRRHAAFVVSLVVCYFVIIEMLKGLFAFPRPAGANTAPVMRWIPPILHGLFTDATTADGFGFPSGHAFGSTLFWGGLALVLDHWRFRTRLFVASVIVTLVSISRLILGVHYLVDVLAGILLGIVVLGSSYWLADRGGQPERIFSVAIVIGVGGFLLHTTLESLVAFGSAVVGWFAWRYIVKPTPT
jgi:membrane-associated phospholipid phosphatase